MRALDEIERELSKPLDRSHVKPPSKYGPKGEYIEGWFAIEEANRIFGWDGWSYEIVTLNCVSERDRKIGKEQKDGFGVSYICRVRVVVKGLSKEDVGAGHGYDADCGAAHESASKEAVTDALKRVLRTYGNPFGLALYDKEKKGVSDAAAEQAKAQADEAGAIKWLKDSPNLAALEKRMATINASKPHLVGNSSIEAAFREKKNLFEPPFPGDEVAA